jgi:hypothetical protein
MATSNPGPTSAHPIASDGFDEEITFEFWPEVPPDQGGLKIKDERDDERIIKDDGKDKDYKVLVRRMMAIDGLADSSVTDESKKQRMTLLVFDYDATCKATDGRYSQIRTWLDFEDLATTPEDDRAVPTVVAWGPFAVPQRWNENNPDVVRTKGGGAELGASYIANAKLHGEMENQVTSKKRCFDSGMTEKRTSNRPYIYRINGVTWVLQENKDLELGTPPQFRTAVLLKRKTDSPFNITFNFRCRAGILQNIKNEVLSWFSCGPNTPSVRQYTPMPEPRLFDEDDPQCQELLAEVVKPEIGRDNLNKLRNGKDLVKLTHVWGLEPIPKSE